MPEFESTPEEIYELASSPSEESRLVQLERKNLRDDYTFYLETGEIIYLSDVFRLHEAVDEELGAGGVLGYLVTAIEQIILVHIIRLILEQQPSVLSRTLFIKDGPLAFNGQTANMHKPMRRMCKFLFKKHNLFLAGLEKSGPFVDHADEISDKLKSGQILLLSNEYIYTYIKPSSNPALAEPYARSSYYGSKMLFKADDGRIYVITLPTEQAEVVMHPQKNAFHNLDIILSNIQKLKCDMYDNSLIPVALANKLVSLSNHPVLSYLKSLQSQV